MEIKDGIVNNLLCMSCLCVGRCIQEVKDEKLKQYYLDLLKEIPLPVTISSPLLCWECEAVLRRAVAFREQAKDSYRILQTYTKENFNECLQSDVSRQPRLKISHQKSLDIAPDDDVKFEHYEDKFSKPISDVEPEELHTVICDVQRPRRKNIPNGRRAVPLEQEERDPVGDGVKSELPDDELMMLGQMKMEKLDLAAKPKRERRSKVNQSKTQIKNIVSRNIKIEDNKDVAEGRSVYSDMEADVEDLQPILQDVKDKNLKETKAKNQYYSTLHLSYEDMQAERQALLRAESFTNSSYKCETCIMTFSNEKLMKLHNEKRHAVPGKYICSICDTNVSSVDEFTSHYRRHMRTYECTVCNKRISILKDVHQHLLIEHNIYVKRYTCDVCGLVSNSAATHRYHKEKQHSNKPRIQCGECEKTFSHRAGLMNHRLLPNSPDLIQPVRLELCLKCKRKVRSIQAHVCDINTITTDEAQSYMCAACEETFSTLKSFDDHVLRMHGDSDGVESMFFPTTDEFTKWKNEMEQQTNINYTFIDKYDSKRYYHCNVVKEKPDKPNTSYFCPSTIVIQEFSKGLQVHFYKNHHKHSFNKYKLTNKYKNYSINSFLKQSDGCKSLEEKTNDENDLYVQFKTLMEGIVVDAAKINIATLKILIGKALDLTSILNSYDEECDDPNEVTSNQCLTDSQISKALEEQVTSSKRKLEESDSVDMKRPKLSISTSECLDNVPSPKIINSFSLAKSEIDKNKIDPVKISEAGSKNANDDHTPSFNDSYKDFVVKNFPDTEMKKRTRNERKSVMKTKMGQFKPSLSPKGDERKEEAKIPIRLSTDKPKVDFDYEVMEQENGCNILILKI